MSEIFNSAYVLISTSTATGTRDLSNRVMKVTLSGNRVTGYEPFVEGWLQGRKAWGRPVDVLVMPDGALLVSDDQAGVIYRISYAR